MKMEMFKYFLLEITSFKAVCVIILVLRSNPNIHIHNEAELRPNLLFDVSRAIQLSKKYLAVIFKGGTVYLDTISVEDIRPSKLHLYTCKTDVEFVETELEFVTTYAVLGN